MKYTRSSTSQKRMHIVNFQTNPSPKKLIRWSMVLYSLMLKNNCNPIAICETTHTVILGWLVSYLDF
jgi:hypothetical protein